MNQKIRNKGVIIPMVTPFEEMQKIDFKSLERLLNFLVNANTVPFVLGTTGECLSISQKIRTGFVRKVAEYVNQRTDIYVGISDTCVENSILQAKQYYDLGVHVFVCHPPPYYPLTQDQILKFYHSLADRLPAPLMIYNIPGTTKISISLDVLEQLSFHDNIIGLKDSERSMERMDKLVSLFASRNDFSILSGWTVKSLYALESGFDGIVPSTANLVPHLFAELYDAVKRDLPERSRALQAQIDPIADFHQNNIVLSEVIAMLKVMMAEFGLCGPAVMPPLTRLGKDRENHIRENMKQFDFGDIERYLKM